jgi:hypothetical protein
MRLVGIAVALEIGRDDAEAGELGDDVAPAVPELWESVQEEHGMALTRAHVMDPRAAYGDVIVLEKGKFHAYPMRPAETRGHHSKLRPERPALTGVGPAPRVDAPRSWAMRSGAVKAVVWKGPGELCLAELPDPRPGPGEVLLRVRDCGICGSDLHAAKLGLTLMPGSVLGHEFSGTIAELGEGVEGWRVGDRVVPLPYHSCGTCDRCRDGEGMFCPAMRSMGFGDVPGAYAEYALAVPSSLLRLPDSVSFRLVRS